MAETPNESNLDNQIDDQTGELPGGRCAGTDAPAAESFAPGIVNKNETNTIELVIVAGLVAVEALVVLLAVAVALVLTLARPRPAGSSARVMPPPAAAPAVHPLALMAAELEALPVTRLRPMVGVRSKRIRKAELVALAVAC